MAGSGRGAGFRCFSPLPPLSGAHRFFGSGTFFTAIRNPLFIAILAALAWGVRDTMKASKSDIRDLRLLAPIELFQAAAQSGGRVFVNPPAYAHAALLAPDLFARLPSLDLIGKMCTALPMWREEDRREPFSALIFTGNRLAEIRPLLESLSSDWYLARMDNHGLLYLRGSPPRRKSLWTQTHSPIPVAKRYSFPKARSFWMR